MFDAILDSIDYIEDNIKTNLSVYEVANHISYSQFYFSREFSNITQNSPYNYIMKRKISLAYHELLNTDKKIVEIAAEYGFNSHENFIRAFKKLFDLAPNQAQKLGKKDNLYLFERIDKEYLNFLYKLKVRKSVGELERCHFIGKPTDKLVGNEDNLIVLSNDHPKSKEYFMYGKIVTQPVSLSYQLKDIIAVVKVFSGDLEHSLRFFIDNFYEELHSSEYILMRNKEGWVEFMLPLVSKDKV